MQAMIGTRVQLEGIAADAKGGAIVRVQSHPVYVDGLDRWPPHVHGRRVKVEGTLVSKQRIPEAEPDPRKPQSAGATGAQYVLEGARWSLAAQEPSR